MTTTPPSPSAPGDLSQVPKLSITYRTDGDVTAFFPHEVTTESTPEVALSFYCAIVHNEPEYGISVKIGCTLDERPAWYTMGIGITQESAIFVSRETNGQPKYPCDVRYERMGTEIRASAVHQGVTFAAYRGRLDGPADTDEEPFEELELWVKHSRAVGGTSGAWDLPPRFVEVAMAGTRVRREPLAGALTLTSSVWDPVADLLPPTTAPQATLLTTRFHSRTITAGRPLDADSFAPLADTIGGSRWPGQRGAPRDS